MTRFIHPLGVAKSQAERLAITICFGAFGTLGFSITAPLLPDLADALSVDRASIGLVQAAVSIPGVALSALIGYFADRLGRRRVVLFSLLLFATFGTAGFFTRTYWLLVAARVIQGIGTSGILGMGIVMIGDLFRGTERTRAMGFNLTGITTVNMLGPVASGLLGATGVFRPFLIFLIGYPLFLWVTRLPSDPPQAAQSPLRHAGAALRSLRARGNAADYAGVLAATVGATVLLHGFGYTTTPLFLDSEFGIGSGGRGLVIAFFQIGTALAAVQIGRLRARNTGERLVSRAFVLLATGSAITAAAPVWWVVALGLGVSGVGFGLFVPLAQDKAASVGGAVYRGLTVLTWVTFVRVAQVAGPPVGSSMAVGLGPRVTFGVGAVAMLAFAVAWRPARSRLRRSERFAASRGDGVEENEDDDDERSR